MELDGSAPDDCVQEMYQMDIRSDPFNHLTIAASPATNGTTDATTVSAHVIK